MDIKEFYKREDVQKELFRLAENREVQIWFGNIRGKRPEIIAFQGDIQELANQGMTSFHISEERWKNIHKLKPGLPKKTLDENRLGWDCVLDLDSKHLPYAHETAKLIIEALKFHNIDCYDIKFSGNHGYHIAIPFEAFPQTVNNIDIKNFFPDGIRIIADYIKNMIKEHLTKAIQTEELEHIAKKAGKAVEDITTGGKFDVYKAVDIDSILISSRHLFRCAYSQNEKSGLISIPIDDINTFDKEQAKIENVKTIRPFLNKTPRQNEAAELLIQALDWHSKQIPLEAKKEKTEFKTKIPEEALGEQVFPPCMKKLKEGLPDDGRKRAVFIYINFLLNMGWDYEKIEKELQEWNKKNAVELKWGYIQAQLNWFKKQEEIKAPPNCQNEMYYKGTGICCPDTMCAKIKNPAQYAKRRAFLNNTFKKKKPKKTSDEKAR